MGLAVRRRLRVPAGPRHTDVRLLFRREVRLLIFAPAAIKRPTRYRGWRSSPSRPT